MENKNALYIALFFILSIFFIGGVVVVSYNNSASDAEILVNQTKDSCIQTYDKGIATILDVAHVDENTKIFLKELINGSATKDSEEVKNTYSELLNGNPQPFMLLMSNLGKTDFTVTAQVLQREIVSQRSEMLVCTHMLNSTQAELRKILGMNASGKVVKFPQKYLNLDFPSVVYDETLRDNDHDGKTTVLDYRPPVSVEVSGSFGTGEGLPKIELP